MKTAAHVNLKTGLVENIIVADASVDKPEEGYQLVDVSGQPKVGPGYVYSGGIFTAPPPPKLATAQATKAPPHPGS